MDLVISTKANFPAVKKERKKVGYRHVRDLGIQDREAIKRTDERVPFSKISTKWMKHHLYVYVDGTRERLRHTSFRNYLNENWDARIEYESIKKEIEHRSGGDRKAYVEAKENGGKCTAFIERILTEAQSGPRD